ncbi:Chromatin assembly factor 1 subunit rlf2 [Tolypocladium ophioglossoides CBS 100239]|uniref:Chromatin assembly factor 1 subunit rlf2 n=1 Tax=Tolypocladium ophioglossoides (strain CBS 100239) TaxID=1163406 RepID=A0A0L0NIJ6_TOLOC|nr:Chromatin assembly factor 1 subunit rlf2 [Tolypocladium ophioglossoides CBS 100239]
MPLLQMNPNIQETESAGRKRSHDEFAGDLVKMDVDADTKMSGTATIRPTGDSFLPPISQNGIRSSPRDSPALSDAGSSTPARNSPSPQTPTKAVPSAQSTNMPSASSTASATRATTAAKPAAKRKKLTPIEKAARVKEAAEKKKEREEQAAVKAAEKAKMEEEKVARAKEREEQAAVKAAEKAKLDEEKTARAKEREEKRKRKEEEDQAKAEKKRKKEEEQNKKARSQMRIGAFFGMPKSPKKTAAESDAKSGSPKKPDAADSTPKPALSAYDKLFRPFFVKNNTRWKRSLVQMDEETREAKSRILDEYISGERELESQTGSFDPVKLLCLPGKPPKRGRLHHPVKHIMETAYKEADKSGNRGGSAAKDAAQQVRKRLAKVPMKVIAFSQDVRPPYYGTVTFKPFALGRGNMYRLARRTTGRRLPLDYEYDSEAEWQDEEGEDVDVDDDDEELDDEDDMEGFLDDSEDAGLARRVFVNTMEPDSTGICFEDHHCLGLNRKVYEHRMEFIHDGLERSWGIDPWSTRYWEPEYKIKPAKGAQTSETGTKMAPPPTPVSAFAALKGHATGAAGSMKLVKSELMNDVKRAILDNKALSKVGIIDFIFHQFRDGVSRAEVKNTIELVAEKKGAGRSKEWDLKPGHEIKL